MEAADPDVSERVERGVAQNSLKHFQDGMRIITLQKHKVLRDPIKLSKVAQHRKRLRAAKARADRRGRFGFDNEARSLSILVCSA